LKILVLFQSPWWNAAAYYAYNLVKSLSRLEHEVIFVGSSKTPVGKKITEEQYNIIDINLFENNPLKFICNIKKVNNILVDEKIDILLPISAPGHIIVGIIKQFLKKEIPILKVGLDNVPPVKNFLNKFLHNKLTDYFIFPGQSTKVKYDSFFSIDKYSIIHAPLNIKQFTEFHSNEDLKAKYAIPKDKIIISFIGRFSPEKGIFFLLDIIKETLNKSEDHYFILSGSQEQIKYSDVEKKIEEFGINDRIKIINKVEDVREIISITDIGIMSSRFSEFICRIAMEFMAFKKPIVAPNVNVIPEVVGSIDSGFIYQLNDFNEASFYLLKLLEDKNLLKTMGNNAYNRMNQNYDITVFDRQINSILETIK
jgi:glycosyltransferase involved in cell wall biosynthesis